MRRLAVMSPLPEASSEASLDAYRLSRRGMFPLIGAATLAALVVPRVAAADDDDGDNDDGESAPSRFVYVGTYTAPHTAPGGMKPSTAKGIYVFKMDGRTGGLTQIQIFEIENPSWVTVDAHASHLYATSEVSTWKGTSNSGGGTAVAAVARPPNNLRNNNQPTQRAN